MKLKFVYWFAYYNLNSPSVRYRGKYPLIYLKNNYGINSYFIIPGYKLKNIFQFFRAYFSALFFRKSNSIIVIQRINSNRIYSGLLKLLIRIRKSNTIYDLDDADYLEYSPETIYYFVKNCSVVSVGSHELVKNLTRLNKHIVLNTSPTPDLSITKKNKNSLFTIGWIGDFRGGHKEGMLTLFFPSLKNLPFKIKLILLGVSQKSEYDFLTDHFKTYPNVDLEMPQQINWTDEKDIQQRIIGFDVGIATLLDTELQRSKSAFKTKQYLNNGVPVLSSNISENNLFVEDGKNGFICSTPADFTKRMIEINGMNADKYQVLSENARNSISNFNLHAYCNNLISYVESK